MRRLYEKWRLPHLEKYMSHTVCPACEGRRLRPEALAVTFRGRPIDELARQSIRAAHEFFRGVELAGNEALVGREVMKEVTTRLSFLERIGLGYLTLERRADTLAGGELQRIRLARQLGSGLQGILYILDEPSIGLHHRDNDRLIEALHALRDQGNTIFVIEHDEETMRTADHLIDIGPGAGSEGGEIVAQGTPRAIARAGKGLTGEYLAGKRTIATPANRRAPGDLRLVVEGASHHNLKEIDVSIPLGLLVAVTGVSGSGKSTLVHYVLKRALDRHLNGEGQEPGAHRRILGLEAIDKAIEIDQSPIGRTPRSNPATYVKAFDLVRDLMAEMPLSKVRGYPKGRFSFNRSGGRCEECEGAGIKLVDMQFFAPVEVVCEACQGLRYNSETLEVRFKGLSIHDILELTIDEALAFFANQKPLRRILETLVEVGLGYLRLGQPSTTLSGGEAQRIKLVRELRRPATGKTFYILDEPTTGLHFADIEKLLHCLQRLVEHGNTVLVIEHNLDVVKVADWVIDLGPEGGDEGGHVVYEGPFDGILTAPGSHTGDALARHLGIARRKSAARSAVSRRARRRAAGVSRDLVLAGARKNNLKNVDVTIPAGSITVVTGVSGSGKTSLVLDTIYTEGQRRFVESLSTYARRFLGRLDRAPVDSISGLAPAIAIDQRTAPPNPRSTVATVTEIHDHLRLLYARIGRAHCPRCGEALASYTPAEAARDALAKGGGHAATALVLAPLYLAERPFPTPFSSPDDLGRARKELAADGNLRVLVDGEVLRLDDASAGLAENATREAREIHLVIDRVTLSGNSRGGLGRLTEAFERAYERSGGFAFVDQGDGSHARLGYSRRPGCTRCHHYLFQDLTPRQFSFNHHSGACPGCSGVGERYEPSVDAIVENPHRPVIGGALATPIGRLFSREDGCYRAAIEAVAHDLEFDLRTPFRDLPAAARKALLGGVSGTVEVSRRRQVKGGETTRSYRAPWPGILAIARKQIEKAEGERTIKTLGSLFTWSTCQDCGGERLRPEILAVKVGGHSIANVVKKSVAEALEFFERLDLDRRERKIAEEVASDVKSRLAFLRSVGLHYITLDRPYGTLTGGEAQRIRLATQLGSRLAGVCYCLDEPTIGLHPRDIGRLLATLEGMRDLGNTVILVEHDETVIRRADHVIDIGPGAGSKGGEVVASGTPAALGRSKTSLTGAYLSGRRAIPTPAQRRPAGTTDGIAIRGASQHNLKGIDAFFPESCLVAVTGVSGSGKSSLVLDCLVEGARARLARRRAPSNHESMSGLAGLREVVVIDQQPIGRSARSNPATYTGVMDSIRTLFASTSLAKAKGFRATRFSFNVRGGRCETCEGRGQTLVEMHFLSDVWILCEDCRGRRFNAETLAVRFKEKSIAEVLDLDVSEAREFFASFEKSIVRPLSLLEEVGLGYLKLGQSVTTLSGGEAQRLKLATELSRRPFGRALYILDEPTTGLHMADVEVLLAILHRLVDQKHTVVVIEHHLDVVKNADWVIDLGPEGGAEGGAVVFAGRPEDLALCPTSHTGRALAPKLAIPSREVAT